MKPLLTVLVGYPLITIYPTFSQRGYSQFSGELLACDYLTKTIKNPTIPQDAFNPILNVHEAGTQSG
jgi:hypothetical protein